MHLTGERACAAEETRHSCAQSRDVRGGSESCTVAIVEMVTRGAEALSCNFAHSIRLGCFTIVSFNAALPS